MEKQTFSEKKACFSASEQKIIQILLYFVITLPYNKKWKPLLLCPPGGHPIKWEEIIMANEKILVVDDDTNICELLRLYLTKEGYQVTVANDGEEGLEKFNQVKPDMVLLDVMMPKMDGLEVCRRIRKAGNTPVMMLTAKGETFDKVLGLELGADDYMVKPVDLDELLLRIGALLRRAKIASSKRLTAGSLLLDSRRAEACSANFDKVRRYVKRLCTRMMPRTEGIGSEELRLLSAVTPKGEMFYQGTAQALADKFIVFRDDYGAVSRLLLELIRAEALTRGYHIITCPCAMHPEDKIDHILIPELKLAFLTDNRWHPVHLPSVQAVRCTRFLDRENLAAYRARLRFNERAAAELLEQASALMAQAKSCHDELETYYRAAVDFGKVDEAAAECMEMFGLK